MATRSIIHVDMDAFYAAVEVLFDPALAGKPLIIGALPSERGVVATCSYEARKFGVRSAMNIKEAYRLCPHGIYMHPNMDRYIAASRQIHAIWDDYTDLSEYVSLDEGYLDVTHSAQLFGGAMQIGRDIKERTQKDVGLSCSVGIGYSMMSAKIASEEGKPGGIFEIADARALLRLIVDRNVRVIYGVGVKSAATLAENGVRTVADVLENADKVRELLGKHGHDIVRLAEGVDARRVATPPKSKSLGKEHTFQKDVTNFGYLRDALLLMAKRLSFKIRIGGLSARTVTLKATYGNMVQVTRSKTGPHVSTTREIYEIAAALLDKIERRPIRLIGISLGGLTKEPVQQISLFDEAEDGRLPPLQELLLELQYKYGLDKIATAAELLARENLRADGGGDEIRENNFNKRM
ncbi:MAG: DNA polymerase IV [Clostridiales bacterium]|jgi:DNA polymerase-4/DNA polymerase IV (DinB-like DNA polymerase)|nr:DNA polymerase IV [Clostridiales bacterium]